MKQAENNEIDILLRGLGRKAEGARFQTDSEAATAEDQLPASGSHLDPDELSLYAEGKLPAAARARYTAHLADCDDCRVIVGQLTIALGVVGTEPPEERVPAGPTWREKLRVLLSPNVLRYAVPALVLVTIGVIGLFALRPPKEDSLVARNGVSEPAHSVSQQAKQAPGLGEIASKDERQDQQNQREQKPRPAPPETAGQVKKAGDKGESNSPTPSSREDAAKDSKSEAEASARPPADTSATAAAPAPAPAKAADAAKEQPAKVANEKRSDDEDLAAQNREQRNVANVAGQRGPSASKVNSQQVVNRKAKAAPGTEARGGGAVGRARRSESDSETRTIAGRRFRKEDNAWTDTAYDSSQSTINVARGSEQYRALVADEPEIDLIAQQLSGEVIVVWKGRAYRIR